MPTSPTMDQKLLQLRQKISKFTKPQLANWLKGLSKEEIKVVQLNPDLFVKDYQIIPEGNWRYFWFRGARMVGKTFTSTAWLASKALNGAKEVAIVGPTHKDLKKEIIPVFKSQLPPNFITIDDQQNGIIELKNGCTVKIYSSEYEIRGCNAEYAIAEEIAKWCDMMPEKIEERWKVFNLGVRSTRIANPQILISSTPKSYKFFIDFEKEVIAKNPRYAMKVVTIDEITHITEEQRETIKESLGKTRLGLQELYAQILTDVPGALWNTNLLDGCRGELTEDPIRIVIGVDPAVSQTGDETGIIVAALLPGGICIILEDASGQYTPNQWAKKVYDLYVKYEADRIIAEKNNGGDLVEVNMKTINPHLPIKLVHANKGKITRAEPVAALYEQGKVKHIKVFPELEAQMTTYTGDGRQKSPDRMDAMVYAVMELMLQDIAYGNRAGAANMSFY